MIDHYTSKTSGLTILGKIVTFLSIVILFILLSFINCYGVDTYIISDYAFTNINEKTREQYLKYFSFVDKDNINYIYDTARSVGINPLIIFTLAQRESSQWTEPTRHINDYYLGCAIHSDRKKKRKKNKEFYRQTWIACSTVAKHFREAEQNKMRVYVWDSNSYIPVQNAATYCLYMYTPLYHITLADGEYGNYSFRRLYDMFQREIK